MEGDKVWLYTVHNINIDEYNNLMEELMNPTEAENNGAMRNPVDLMEDPASLNICDSCQ